MPISYPRDRGLWVWSIVVMAGLLSLILIRATLVERVFGVNSACKGCFLLPSVASDLIYFASALMLSFLLVLAGRWWVIAAVVIFGTSCAFHFADLAVSSGFGLRLYVTDIPKFGANPNQVAGVLTDFLTTARVSVVLIAASVLAGVLVIGVCIGRRSDLQRRRIGIGGVLAILPVLGIASFWPQPDYVHPDATQNVLVVNLQYGSNIRYSQAYREAHGAPAPPRWQKMAATSPTNIIILVAESLSAYHSGLYGAEISAVPQLDELVRRHGAYAPDFWANGFTTDAGLISVFASELPLPTPGRYHSVEVYQGFGIRAQPLYRQLTQQGYRLGFLNGSDLGFLGMGDFFERIGFHDREDSRSAAFQQGDFRSAPRGQFGAVADDILLRRSLAWMDQQTQPYLLGLLTISTHPPFMAPGQTAPNEQAAFEYLDRVLAEWFRELQARRFFDDGVLVVVGDHRSMTPVHAEEHQLHGRRAAARVPLLVFGGGLRGKIEGAFQQVDILPSVAAMAGFSADPGFFHGQIFPVPRPAQVRVHVAGAERDRVLLEHRGQLYHYRMAGDRSTIEAVEQRGDIDPQPWLIELNRQRFSRGELPHNYVEWLMRPG